MPVSPPPSVTASAASSTKNGPYGAGVSRQIGATASTQGQPAAATPTAYGSAPCAYAQPWQAYE